MAQYTRRYARGRWAGRTDTILEAVAAANERLSDWLGEKPEVRINASLRSQSIATEDIAELESILTKELGTIRKLNVKLGGDSEDRVEFEFSNQLPGLRYQVAGRQPDAVRGLWAHLKEILNSDQHLPQRYARGFLVAIMALLAVGLLIAWVASGETPTGGVDLSQATVSVPALIASVGTLILLGLFAWLTPNLEVLRPGDRPRVRRFRAQLFATVLAFVIGLASSIATAGLS